MFSESLLEVMRSAYQMQCTNVPGTCDLKMLILSEQILRRYLKRTDTAPDFSFVIGVLAIDVSKSSRVKGGGD